MSLRLLCESPVSSAVVSSSWANNLSRVDLNVSISAIHVLWLLSSVTWNVTRSCVYRSSLLNFTNTPSNLRFS